MPLQVETTCGRKLLGECFLPRSSIDAGLVQLMAQLQLPILQESDPDSRGWDFLHSLGVSMELTWPTLHKVLQQLSSAGARPPLASMQQLYKSVAALEALSQVAAADLRAAFESEALLFVPGRQPGFGSWHRSDEVAWQPGVGVRKLFPHIRFISGPYRVGIRGPAAGVQQQQCCSTAWQLSGLAQLSCRRSSGGVWADNVLCHTVLCRTGSHSSATRCTSGTLTWTMCRSP